MSREEVMSAVQRFPGAASISGWQVEALLRCRLWDRLVVLPPHSRQFFENLVAAVNRREPADE